MMKRSSMLNPIAMMQALFAAITESRIGRNNPGRQRTLEEVQRDKPFLRGFEPRRVKIGKIYKKNGDRECARRVRQIEAGQITVGHVPRLAPLPERLPLPLMMARAKARRQKKATRRRVRAAA